MIHANGLLLLCLLWILWCTAHSLLINRRIAAGIQSSLGRFHGYYRSGYVLFSLITFLPVFHYQRSLPATILFDWPGAWLALRTALLLYAASMFVFGARAYDMKFFLGFSQWPGKSRKESSEKLPFRTSGILHHVRHPWYSGGLALLWSYSPITDVSSISNLLLSCYLVIGSFLEERRLKEEIGLPYRQYCLKTPMLIPWKLFLFCWPHS